MVNLFYESIYTIQEMNYNVNKNWINLNHNAQYYQAESISSLFGLGAYSHLPSLLISRIVLSNLILLNSPISHLTRKSRSKASTAMQITKRGTFHQSSSTIIGGGRTITFLLQPRSQINPFIVLFIICRNPTRMHLNKQRKKSIGIRR